MKCDWAVNSNEDIPVSTYFTKEIKRLGNVSIPTNDEISGVVVMNMQFAGLIKEQQITGSSTQIVNLIYIWLLLNYGTKHPLREEFFNELSFKVIS